MNIDPARLVFVGGLHRSGTTPLAKILATHPDISGLTDTGVREDEGQHLQPVYPRAKLFGGSGRFAYSPEAHLTEQSPLVSPANAERMLAAWTPHWDLSARLLVEKSPPNIIMGRFLQATYPGSALIVVVRHPIAVALSNKKWRRFLSRNPRKFQTLSGMVDHWLTAHTVLAGDIPRLQRVLVVHYEQLVASPRTELRRIEAFLGLESPIPDDALTKSHRDSYAAIWDAYRSVLRPGGWQRKLIERRHAQRIATFGYGVDDISGHRPVDSPSGLLPGV